MAKNIILFLFLSISTQLVSAQTSNLVLFSEKSAPFTLVLNGVQVNMSPALNVKVTNLETSRYHVRVIFNNPSIPEFEDQIAVNQGNEVTYALQSDNTGMTTLRFVNEFSLYYRPIPPAGQQTIVYTGPLTYNPPQPTPVFSGASGGTGSIDITVGGQASDEPPMITGGTTSTTTTTTTVTQGGGEIIEGEVIEGEIIDPNIRPDPLPGYTGPIGCDWPMESPDFDDAKASVNSQSFSDSKMRVAKQVARNNCLLSTQVKDLLGLFSFETDKLEFAKFAFDFTYDRGNYYKINDAFSFESSIEDLENFLQGR
jgi:hypothetical protein